MDYTFGIIFHEFLTAHYSHCSLSSLLSSPYFLLYLNSSRKGEGNDLLFLHISRALLPDISLSFSVMLLWLGLLALTHFAMGQDSPGIYFF